MDEIFSEYGVPCCWGRKLVGTEITDKSTSLFEMKLLQAGAAPLKCASPLSQR